jgi:ATP/maltotriose-dependent transcriptional regulator MalT
MALLERDRLLTELDRRLDQACAGTGALVFVSGEAGIGKSALIAHFVAAVRNRAVAWWGACDSLQTPSALGPLWDIARQMGRGQERFSEDLPRIELFKEMFDVLAERSAIVVLEDLHWADAATHDLLRYLGRRIQRTRSLLIASYRDDELSATHPLRVLLGDLATQPIVRLTLSPLSADAVRTLVGDAHIDAANLHKQTAGNPFFVTEVIAAGDSGLPATVRDAVIARAARLGPSARALLDVAAVAGPRVEPWLLERLAGAEAVAVDECLALGVLRLDADVFVFRHELARQAILDGVPPWRRVQLHRLVLQTLETAHGIDVARLVHHAVLGQVPEAVLRLAPVAAKHAAEHGAHREAAAHFATALAHFPAGNDDARAGLLEARSYECYLIGDAAGAVAQREAALALRRAAGDRLKEGDNLRWLSRLNWFLGYGSEARRYAEAAVQVLEALPAGPALAMAYSNKAQLHMLAYESATAIEWGERAIELATRLEAKEILAHARNNVGTSRAQMGDEGGWEQLESSLAFAHEHGLEEHAARAYCNFAATLVGQRRYVRAAPYFTAGIEYCIDRDLTAWSTYLMAWRARSSVEQGCWDDATADAVALVDRPGVPAIARIPALAALATVRLRRDDPGANTLLDEANQLARGIDETRRIAPVLAVRVEAAWLAGDLKRCAAEADLYLKAAKSNHDPWALGEAACWKWRAGALHTIPPQCAAPYEKQLRGDWQGAAQAWQELDCPYEQALALFAGDEAAQVQALAILDRLGAVATAQAVRRAMRERGARSIPRGPRASTQANASGLTKREVDILGLVAQGLSNAQIGTRRHISVRTVDHHVAAILRKLDVTSRGEAVKRAQDLRLVDPR